MPVQTPRKKTAKKGHKPTRVRVDPRVMREAKLLVIGGRYTKIEVVDSGTVVVR